jgi:hypothetical protein
LNVMRFAASTFVCPAPSAQPEPRGGEHRGGTGAPREVFPPRDKPTRWLRHFLVPGCGESAADKPLSRSCLGAVENGRRSVPPAGCRQPNDAIREGVVGGGACGQRVVAHATVALHSRASSAARSGGWVTTAELALDPAAIPPRSGLWNQRIYSCQPRAGGTMPLIKRRTCGKQVVRRIVRLDRENERDAVCLRPTTQ